MNSGLGVRLTVLVTVAAILIGLALAAAVTLAGVLAGVLLAAGLLLALLAISPANTSSRSLFAAGAALNVVAWEPAPIDILAIPLLAILLLRAGPSAAGSLRRYFLFCIPFLAFQLLSLLAEGDLPAGAHYLGITVLVVWLGGCGALLGAERSALRPAAAGFVAGAVLTAAISLASLAHLVPIPKVLYFGVRLQGFFKDPNVFAPNLTVAFLVLLAAGSLRAGWPWRGARILGLGVLAMAVLLAYSRAAWIGFVVSGLAYLALAPTQLGAGRRWVLAVLLLVPALGVLVLNQLELLPNSYLVSRLGLQSYDLPRFSHVTLGLGFLAEQPLIGHGPGSDATLLGFSTHDLYIKLLVENGLLGFASFLFLAGGACAASVRAALGAADPAARRVAAVVAAGLLGSFVNSAAIDSIHWRHLWLLVGLGWAVGAWQLAPRAAAAARRMAWLPAP